MEVGAEGENNSALLGRIEGKEGGPRGRTRKVDVCSRNLAQRQKGSTASSS